MYALPFSASLGSAIALPALRHIAGSTGDVDGLPVRRDRDAGAPGGPRLPRDRLEGRVGGDVYRGYLVAGLAEAAVRNVRRHPVRRDRDVGSAARTLNRLQRSIGGGPDRDH